MIALAKEISKQPSIDSVLWFTLMKCLDETEQGKIQMYGSSVKEAPGSRIERNSVFKETNRIKILNGLKVTVTLEQIPCS